MARPRVILASHDAEMAVDMIAALNPKRYRVEHIFDLSEALLRAELVLAHALVIHTNKADQALAKRCGHSGSRLSLVFLSPDRAMDALARQLDARFLPLPLEPDDFARIIYRAVTDAENRRERSQIKLRKASERSSAPRVVLLAPDPITAGVIAAVLHKELGVQCHSAVSTREALALMDEPADCMVADPALLMADAEGAAIAHALKRNGTPLVALSSNAEVDISAAGQLAWDLVPQVRRSLTARALARAQAG